MSWVPAETRLSSVAAAGRAQVPAETGSPSVAAAGLPLVAGTALPPVAATSRGVTLIAFLQ
ncbi:hypothetical protein [Amycolatopsis jiangsuensis]|uniref:Uncharacterized protein n=1 Tax=Amycolatopsis jiangsuensis TaxID=1181879 RepID=A0A840ITV9_9PSEU|nr:hypothetical protein [Amycolatopsis jiangsuensis]MBB4685896.1 hypothetical protein [Amycolatopsis jiangsuensis]